MGKKRIGEREGVLSAYFYSGKPSPGEQDGEKKSLFPIFSNAPMFSSS